MNFSQFIKQEHNHRKRISHSENLSKNLLGCLIKTKMQIQNEEIKKPNRTKHNLKVSYYSL